MFLPKIERWPTDERTNGQTEVSTKNDFFLIGSSMFREVRDTDLVNGTVKCISGGKIKDVKEAVLYHRGKKLELDATFKTAGLTNYSQVTTVDKLHLMGGSTKDMMNNKYFTNFDNSPD